MLLCFVCEWLNRADIDKFVAFNNYNLLKYCLINMSNVYFGRCYLLAIFDAKYGLAMIKKLLRNRPSYTFFINTQLLLNLLNDDMVKCI
jgi:hypothetical protein